MKVSTANEYYEKTTKIISVESGNNIRIQAMGAKATIFFYGIIPDEGLETDESSLAGFLMENFIEVTENVIVPCIVEPKLDPDRIAFRDLTVLLKEILTLSGMVPEEDEVISPNEAESPSATE